MSERKLARVVIIDSLHPIKGKDRIELAMVGGWQVIVQKGLYEVGSKAMFFEVDSLIPIESPAGASLAGISSKLKHVIDGQHRRSDQDHEDGWYAVAGLLCPTGGSWCK